MAREERWADGSLRCNCEEVERGSDELGFECGLKRLICGAAQWAGVAEPPSNICWSVSHTARAFAYCSWWRKGQSEDKSQMNGSMKAERG